MLTEYRPVSESAQPRTIGELLDNTFRQYRTHFRFWFLAAVCILIPFLILDSIFNFSSVNDLKTFFDSIMASTNNGTTSASPTETLQAFQGLLHSHALIMTWVLAIVETLIVTPLLYGTLLNFVTELVIFGHTPNVDESFFKSLRRLFPVIITVILYWVLYFIALSLGVFAIALVAALVNLAHLAVLTGVVVALLIIGFVVGAIWIFIKMEFIISAVLQEEKIVFTAMVRSWVLVKGNFWRTFGYLLVLIIIIMVLQGGLAGLIGVLVKNTVLSLILTNLITLLATPLLLLGKANLYADLRIRTDSLDLHRWLSSSGDGDHSSSDDSSH